MTQFDDRIEGEIKTHEKEMIRKAMIAKYGDKPLAERIEFVMSTYKQDHWKEEEMVAKLTDLGLIGEDKLADVATVFKNLQGL